MFIFFFSTPPFVAIIGDIISSKKVRNRYETQQKLTDILNQINSPYADDIAAKFMITLGDEFQGLLRCGKNTMKIIQTIERGMNPVKIRFGIGIGDIKTKINPDIPLGADGTAYHNARQMIEEIKKAEKKQMESRYDIKISIDHFQEIADLMNSIFSLCTAIKSKWTYRQTEIIYDNMEYGDSQIDAAKRLGITQSSIQKGLAASNYYTYAHSMELISAYLEQIKEKSND